MLRSLKREGLIWDLWMEDVGSCFKFLERRGLVCFWGVFLQWGREV